MSWVNLSLARRISTVGFLTRFGTITFEREVYHHSLTWYGLLIGVALVTHSKSEDCPPPAPRSAGGSYPNRLYALTVATRPRGVRMRNPSWIRNGS